ncbi:MAG TPA: HTH domain-containing protein [Pirellulaceae bacterium]|nr:HTH domain-containing protein [Pirellulaceae bacterium]
MTTEPQYQQLRTDGRHPFPSKPSDGPSVPRDRVERFVELIRLLADGREWPAKRLSAELQVTVRTIQRDMQLLEKKGLAARKTGRQGSYRLIQETAWEGPRLSAREVIALLVMAAGDELDKDDSVALEAVHKIISFQPQNMRDRLLEFTDLLRSQPAASRQWLCRQGWLATILEGLAGTRPLKVWLTPLPGQARAVPLEIVPTAFAMRSGQWILRSHRVSPAGGEVTLELAQVAKVEFVAKAE